MNEGNTYEPNKTIFSTSKEGAPGLTLEKIVADSKEMLRRAGFDKGHAVDQTALWVAQHSAEAYAKIDRAIADAVLNPRPRWLPDLQTEVQGASYALGRVHSVVAKAARDADFDLLTTGVMHLDLEFELETSATPHQIRGMLSGANISASENGSSDGWASKPLTLEQVREWQAAFADREGAIMRVGDRRYPIVLSPKQLEALERFAEIEAELREKRRLAKIEQDKARAVLHDEAIEKLGLPDLRGPLECMAHASYCRMSVIERFKNELFPLAIVNCRPIYEGTPRERKEAKTVRAACLRLLAIDSARFWIQAGSAAYTVEVERRKPGYHASRAFKIDSKECSLDAVRGVNGEIEQFVFVERGDESWRTHTFTMGLGDKLTGRPMMAGWVEGSTMPKTSISTL